MIEARNISKTFENKQVLYDVSTVFERGKVNLIIGQSGSGKTVLLKCLVGLFEVNQGDVIYDNRNFTRMKPKERKLLRSEIGMLFQGSALFDSMTILENVLFPLRMFSKLSDSEKLKRAQFCIERVGLSGVDKLFPAEISGGMQKRSAIARAIALNPKYLFCDEPNSGLDPKTGVVIDNLIDEITKEFEITTIINTHDMNSVVEHGENINFIYKGKLWWQGNKNDFLTTNNQELNDFIYATEILRKIRPTK